MGDQELDEIDERMGNPDSMTRREQNGCLILAIVLTVVAVAIFAVIALTK